MILLIGGTSETARIARALVEAGFQVLVSTSTDIPLDIGNQPGLARRVGALDRDGMLRTMSESGIKLVVDASHPYASSVTANTRKAAAAAGIPYVRWVRPSVLTQNGWIVLAADHTAAAQVACSFGTPVLLTTGSKNVLPYVHEAERVGVALVVRVLPYPHSVEACRSAGLPDANIVTGRGPFSTEDNLALMRRFSIGVIVTKDSGSEGGVPEKLEAARIHGCRVVVVQRPEEPPERTFSDLAELVAAVSRATGLSEIG